jgi:hypothetical protein
MAEYQLPTRPREIPAGIKETRFASVGEHVAYAIVVHKRATAQMLWVDADRPIPIPAVGETFELQDRNNPVNKVAGTVSAINHSFGYLGGAVPILYCTTYIIVVD